MANVRLNLLNLVVDDELFDRLGGGRSAVQWQVARSGYGRRLVSQGLGNLEVVQRRRADRPRVAEDTLGFAVKVRELGRVRHGGNEGKRCLGQGQRSALSCVNAIRTFHAVVTFPHKPKHVLLPPVVKTSQSCVVLGLAVASTVMTSFQFSSVIGYWITSATLAATLLVAVSTGADGIDEMEADTAAVALLKKPFTLSRRGICSSATASAGRARTRPDENRIVGVYEKVWW